MNDQLSLRDKIIAYIKTNGRARAHELSRNLPFGRAAIHRNLKKLTDEGLVLKNGKAPIVFYTYVPQKPVMVLSQIPQEIKEFIDKDYMYITPQGKIVYGYDGFLVWLENTKQIPQEIHLAETYVRNRNLTNQARTNEGWIDATSKIRTSFPEIKALDKVLYGDFYTISQFGKTRLGTLMLYAKQAQNLDLIKQVALEIKPLLLKIISEFEIDAVAFIPPSVPRIIQFMTELEDSLNLPLARINLKKSRAGDVIVAQKTLEKIDERVVNARDTIFIKDTKIPFKNILIIDDAVGSGASLNETAKKLKVLLPTESKIIGFAIVGSFKGFDVIREV